MTLNRKWILNVMMVSFSWASFLFLGRKNLKRYLPASILIVIYEAMSVLYVKKKKWWIFYDKPKSYLSGEFAYNIGPFLALALWTLKWGYGNFSKFLQISSLVHFIFATVIINTLKKWRIARLVRINHTQFFLYFFYKAFLLYGLQMIVEKIKSR